MNMLSAVREDSPVDPIAALSRPSGASPTEWFGVTTGGDEVRVRYRYGYLSVTVDPSSAAPREVFGRQLGGPVDGVLTDGAMRRSSPTTAGSPRPSRSTPSRPAEGHSYCSASSTSRREAPAPAGSPPASRPRSRRRRTPRASRRGMANRSRTRSRGPGRERGQNVPTATPSAAPISAVTMLSCRTIRRTWRRVIPIARSIPISRVRSNTVSTSVLITPNRLTMTDRPSST